MKLDRKILAIGGILIIVSALVAGGSAAQAAGFAPSGLNGSEVDTTAGKPSPEGPIEERVKRAVEEVNQEGQDALAELGALDTPEKFQQAEQILKRMDQAAHELRKRAHDRTSDRFDELNDLALGRVGDEARAELRAIARTDNPQKERLAEAVRARVADRKARLEGRWEDRRTRVEQRQVDRKLPKFDFRRPNGRPADHAVALGLRLRLDQVSDGEFDQVIAELNREARFSLDHLGGLDSPGKVQRARKIRARLADRIHQLRERIAQRAADRIEWPESDLQIVAAAIERLGELDTPEIRDKLRRMREAMGSGFGAGNDSQIRDFAKMLRSRPDADRQSNFEQRVDRETAALRHRVRFALEQLGELDTSEKQQKARLLRQRLEEQVRALRDRLARHSGEALDQKFEQESVRLRRDAEQELKNLGRLDSRERVENARRIRARMAEGINRLKREQAHNLRDGGDPRFEILSGLVNDHARDRLMSGLKDRFQDARIGEEMTPDRIRDKARDRARDRVTDAGRERQVSPDRVREYVRQQTRPDGTSSHLAPSVTVPPTATPEPRLTDGDGSTRR